MPSGAQRGWQWRRVTFSDKIRPDLLWLGLIPAGFGLYVLFLWWRFGTPSVLMKSQLQGWNHQASFFLVTYWNSFAALWQSITGSFAPGQDWVAYYGGGAGLSGRLYMVLDLTLPPLLLLCAWLGRRKLLASEWTWLALGILYPLSSNITFSLARYMIPLWPGLVGLGVLKARASWLVAPVIVLSLILLAWCSFIYGSGRWIG
ncbi:MAG: hypothetical protein M3014_02655 [Chloroflexota bacterium]|nr:hypothetical protein [Chloroflexota bacterium]